MPKSKCSVIIYFKCSSVLWLQNMYRNPVRRTDVCSTSSFTKALQEKYPIKSYMYRTALHRSVLTNSNDSDIINCIVMSLIGFHFKLLF